MTEALLQGEYDDAHLLHVNTAYSTSLSDMARASLRKASRLACVLIKALWIRLRRRPSVLYYHPAGGNRSAVLRDLVLLSALRPLFPVVVFHMHARGLPGACADLPGPLRWLARRAYARPDVLLGPSTAIVEEASPLSPRHARVVPNGTRGGSLRAHDRTGGPVQILFLNLISEAKGAGWLLEAFAELRASDVDAHLKLVGEFASGAYRQTLIARARELGVERHVSMPGTAVGPLKWEAMRSADIFCVPTMWPQESFGLVLIEAASCGLPVVAADVPGVREVLEPGESVVLVDPADRPSLTRRLHDLCQDTEARQALGTAARGAFEDRYTLERYWMEIGRVFAMVREEQRVAS